MTFLCTMAFRVFLLTFLADVPEVIRARQPLVRRLNRSRVRFEAAVGRRSDE